MTIFYGLQITTKQPTITDFELGCIDGIIKWSTGRENTELWKDGIILEDSFSEVSQEIEIEACGSYSTMSGFNLKIDNANGLSDRIKALGLDLVNCDILFYTFRDGVSSQDHFGKIADWSYDENEIQITCIDAFRSIHKPLLKKTFNTDEFGLGLSSSLIGKPIPECFGYVSKAKLFPILKEEIYETICTSGGIDFDVAPCTNYTDGATGPNAYKIVHLKTIDKTFLANTLAGKFLTAIKVGNQTKRIIGNLASSGGITQIQIESPFDSDLTSVNFWTATGELVWYFQISSLDIEFITSNKGIYDFKKSDLQKPVLFIFDATKKEWVSISSLVDQWDVENFNALGYPGLSIISKPINLDGDVLYYNYAIPESLISLAEIGSNISAVTGTRPTPGTELTNLKDRDDATGYTWEYSNNNGSIATLKIPFRLIIPDSFLDESLKNIYFAFNHMFYWDFSLGFPGNTIIIDVKLIDFLGRITTSLDSAARVLYPSYSMTGLDFPLKLIPWKYFDPNSNQENTAFENAKIALQLNQTEHVKNIRDKSAYPYVIFEVTFFHVGGAGGAVQGINISEVTLVGEKILNLISTEIFTQLRGILYGSNWDGRRTATLPVINIADMIELIIRNFDERPDVIDTTSFDLLGHPSTGLLKDWRIGWQQLDQINSYDLIDQLCRFSFTGLIPKNNGTKALKNFLDVTIVATHKDTNNTILENTIGIKKPTSLANVFNEPQVNYQWNSETQKFDSFIRITRLDQDSFPLESIAVSNETSNLTFSKYKLDSAHPGMIEFVITGGPGFSVGDHISLTDGFGGLTLYGVEILLVAFDSLYVTDPGEVILVLGTDYTDGTLQKYINPKPLWHTFAIGYTDAEYDEAKENWRLCKLSATRYGFTRELPSEMSDCKYFPNMATDWGLADTAKAYMHDLCRWTPFRKDVVPYRLPNTATHAALELLDGITFADSTDQAGTEFTGRIVGKTIVPGLGKDYIEIHLMLDPVTT